MNGRQAVTFEVQRAKGASEVTTYDEAWKEIRKVESENPKVHFAEVFNQVDYTKAQYKSAMEGLIEGAILAVLVVLLFLRDIRATLISALAIPLSAIPAFWFMDLLGITLNFMSTMAMSLVAGVLVDDAIVEIENIVRHMRMGKSAYQASIDAADEIGLAVLATTMAIVAVFLPVALMPGISGQFFKAFGFTVVVSVLMSLLVARMITPLVAAYFLRSHGVQPHAAWKWMDWYLGILKWSLDTTKAHAYRLRNPGFIGWIKGSFRDHRLYMVGAGLGTLLISAVLFGTLSMTFQPPQNFDFSLVNITLPPGSTIKQTEEIADRVAKIVQRDPDVDRTFERVRVGTARVNVVLKKDRVKTSTEYERSMAPALAAIPDARVSFQSQNGAAPTAPLATSCSISAATTPRSSTTSRSRFPRKWRPSPACERRASAATSSAPRSSSRRASMLPPTSASPRSRSARQSASRPWATSSRTAPNSRSPTARCRSPCRFPKMPAATSRRSRTCLCRRRAAARYR